MASWWSIILIVLLFCAFLLIAYTVYLNIRARRLGLPPTYNPFSTFTSSRRYSVAPRTGGLIGWVNDKVREWRYKRNRSAAGAYEGQTLGGHNSGRQGARGRGLDPDDAWDARVGAEADVDPYNPEGGYYEEELGLQDNSTAYRGANDAERGRQMSREHEGTFVGGNQQGLDARYNQEMGITQKDGPSPGPSQNPFDDANATRDSRSPARAGGHKQGQESLEVISPNAERRSLFKESM